jgi:hypothetical protein
MKRYLLLRENQETGPYTLEDLRGLALKSNDLVWVDGESLSWNYPDQIEELKDFIQSRNTFQQPLQSLGYFTASTANSEVLSLSLPKGSDSFHNFKNEETEQELLISDSGESKKTNEKAKTRKPKIGAYGIWITVLLVLLGGTAWMLKTAIDVFQGKGLVHSKASPAVAPLKILPEGVSPLKEDDAVYQNALSREIVPVDTLQDKEPVKKAPKLKELKKFLRIESNDYKVGVFGGISELQLTVINNSIYLLDKVILQVDFLKPNGETLQTEKYTFFAIAAHGKKTLDIPPSRRGVKVKYKILDAKSRDYKLTLVQA